MIIETCSGSSFFCDSLSRCWSAVSHLVWKQMIIVILMRISKVISIRIIMLMIVSPELAGTTIKDMNIAWRWWWICFPPFCDVLDRLIEVQEFEKNSSSFEEQDFLRSLFVEDFCLGVDLLPQLKFWAHMITKVISKPFVWISELSVKLSILPPSSTPHKNA